jgi:hypothetical protein
MTGPLGRAGVGDPRVPTINARKHQRRPPWEAVPENSGVPTINARKRRQWVPWEAAELEVRDPQGVL